MAKLTVASIKQQIAALEAKAQRIAADEMKTSVTKVRALMDSLGVTLEHLGTAVSKKVAVAKKAVAGKKSAASKRAGAGVARYRDRATGATWTGFGRAPGWIASAANRDDYLVAKAAPARAAKAVEKTKAVSKKVAAFTKKAAGPAKSATVKAVKSKAAKTAAAPAKKAVKKSTKKSAVAKPAAAPAKKAAPRKAAGKKVAALAPATNAQSAPGATPAGQ